MLSANSTFLGWPLVRTLVFPSGRLVSGTLTIFLNLWFLASDSTRYNIWVVSCMAALAVSSARAFPLVSGVFYFVCPLSMATLFGSCSAVNGALINSACFTGLPDKLMNSLLLHIWLKSCATLKA